MSGIGLGLEGCEETNGKVQLWELASVACRSLTVVITKSSSFIAPVQSFSSTKAELNQ